MKINLLLAIVFLSFITYANITYLHGIVGMTMRDGGVGCVCHGVNPTSNVNVWIEGPDSLFKGETAQFNLMMTGGPAIEGGFNIANYFGTINPVDTLVSLLSGELTHSSPNPFSNDTVSWNFSYTAPDSLVADTLYSVGNSVNGDGNPGSLDKWNFGENFIIHIIDNPVSTEKENLQPEGFVLYQNYPNPFNPTTIIKYSISNVETHRDASLQMVTLKIYDVLGNEVAELVNEEKQPGIYEVEFSPASSIKHPVSGVYFYQLKAGNFVDAKKMILLK